ncbi:FG-GAP repeat domain-containing protein [Streptomyces sp. NPDC002176]|uniref:FG-GAP repeat domain-containing protein n=1 Tax=Streptomyces sp. NPDC002176 TaxID=3364634 RepID=UPI00384E6299
MLTFSHRPSRRVVIRAVGLATAAVLALVTGNAAPSPVPGRDPSPASVELQAVQAASAAPMLPLFGRKADGHLYDYEPTGTGGVRAAADLGGGFTVATALFQTKTSAAGGGIDLYYRVGGTLYYTAGRGTETKVIGGGWDVYNALVSVGNLGGSTAPDVLARDAAGALWLYQGKSDGTFATKVQAGTSGWNGMDTLAGVGDYTGDGKNDLLARSTTGTLYIYPGTGSATANAILGTRLTVPGTDWKNYTTLVSSGDNSGDGKADLIGRDAAGALWLFKGTGVSTAPFAARVQIGTSGWQAFNTLF